MQNLKITSFLETSRNFLELWILPGNKQFLPILTYWASIQLSFCHWIWLWPQKLKNVIFWCFEMSFISKIRNYKKYEKTCHFWILRLNSWSVTKLSWIVPNWCPIRQNWQKLAISRGYSEFQRVSRSFCGKNRVSGQKLSGIHTLHVESSQNWPIPVHFWNPGILDSRVQKS